MKPHLFATDQQAARLAAFPLVNRPVRMEPHLCRSCGSVATLDASVRQWCACNPSAPFRMIPQSIVNLTDPVSRTISALCRR